MKIAYLASLYPAPSHTFIQREIIELEKLGIEVLRFSVRQSRPEDQLDDTARAEAGKTRSLLPVAPSIVAAMLWLLFYHPLRGLSTFGLALRSAGMGKALLKWSAYFIEAVQLAHWLHQDGAQHLHCHFGNAGSNTAWLAARLAGARLSITFHGIDLDEPEPFHHRAKLADASFAVCISNYGRTILQGNIDARDAHKIAVIRCGFPIPDASIIPAVPGRGEIISVARLSQEKGHRILLEALTLLAAENVAFHCTLVGAGPLQDEVSTEIARRNLGSHVTMAGAVPNGRVVQMIAASDLSVLASYGEGIPIALLESLAWNRPFVATSVGGIPELTPPGASGLLVKPGDAPALAKALKKMLEDKTLSGKLAAAGRNLVAENHNPTRAAMAMRALFSQVTSFR